MSQKEQNLVLASFNKSLFHCPNCQREYENLGDSAPRVNPRCGHTSCQKCIVNQLNSNQSSSDSTCLPPASSSSSSSSSSANAACPQCKKSKGKAAPSVISGYPFNEILIDLMDKRIERLNRVKKNCERCSDERADHACLVCKCDLCGSCWDSVHSFGSFKSHVKTELSHSAAANVGKLSSWPLEEGGLGELSVDRMCSVHENYSRDLLCMDASCPNNGTLICIMCERTTHKGHLTEPAELVAPSWRAKLSQKIPVLFDRLSDSLQAFLKVVATSERISSSSTQSIDIPLTKDDSSTKNEDISSLTNDKDISSLTNDKDDSSSTKSLSSSSSLPKDISPSSLLNDNSLSDNVRISASVSSMNSSSSSQVDDNAVVSSASSPVFANNETKERSGHSGSRSGSHSSSSSSRHLSKERRTIKEIHSVFSSYRAALEAREAELTEAVHNIALKKVEHLGLQSEEIGKFLQRGYIAYDCVTHLVLSADNHLLLEGFKKGNELIDAVLALHPSHEIRVATGFDLTFDSGFLGLIGNLGHLPPFHLLRERKRSSVGKVTSEASLPRLPSKEPEPAPQICFNRFLAASFQVSNQKRTLRKMEAHGWTSNAQAELPPPCQDSIYIFKVRIDAFANPDPSGLMIGWAPQFLSLSSDHDAVGYYYSCDGHISPLKISGPIPTAKIGSVIKSAFNRKTGKLTWSIDGSEPVEYPVPIGFSKLFPTVLFHQPNSQVTLV